MSTCLTTPSCSRLRLERVHQYHRHRRVMEGKNVRIYSRQWGSYWRHNASGYAERQEDAGVWRFESAWRMTRHCGPEKGIEFELVNDEEPVLAFWNAGWHRALLECGLFAYCCSATERSRKRHLNISNRYHLSTLRLYSQTNKPKR